MAFASLQSGTGLYDSSNEHDACGVGFVADLTGERRHDTVARALTVLRNLDHRGAKGADPDSGDGAGILTQMPDGLLRARCGFELPPAGQYAAGLAFLAADETESAREQAAVRRLAAEEGLAVLGWREVPTDPDFCGNEARSVLPRLAQLVVTGLAGESGLALDRKAYCLRKRIEHESGLVCGQPVQRHHRVQGHADRDAAGGVLPRPVRPAVLPRRSRWCTRASRPTRSRPGRWRIRTGWSRTTARSTPSAATGTGCAHGRRSSPPTCSAPTPPGAGSSGCCRS